MDEKASLREIDEYWAMSDVLDANEALDVASDAAALMKPNRSPTQVDPPRPPARPNKATNTRPPPPRGGRR